MTHGRTRIKLYNPVSGNVIKDVVSENTFQGSVISEGLRNLGYAKASLYNTPDNSNPPFAEIVGGILLFDRNDMPANSQFAPLGYTMTGNGAYKVTNSEEPIELGSYDDNSSQIVVGEKKIKMVYQYTRSQAIGNIGCVCLTSKTGGYIGYGNNNNKQTSSLYYLYKNASLSKVCPQITTQLNRNDVICNGALYNFALSGDVLTVTKWRIPLKNASLLDCIEEVKTVSVTSLHYSEIGTAFNLSASNGKIYMSNVGFIRVGTSYVWCYDTATGTITELTFTDTRNYEAYNGASVCHEKAYIFNNGTGAYEVYNLDGTHYDTITAIVGTGGFSNNMAGSFGNHVLLQWRNADWERRSFLYDSQLKVAKIINASSELSGYQHLGVTEEETSKAICFATASGVGMNFQGAYAFNNPLYLATINNLQEILIKDATKAMTVEYTLTES